MFFSQPLQQVHEYVHRILEGQCRPDRTRQSLLEILPASSQETLPFLWKDIPFPDDLFQYPPPFGFRGLQGKVEELLKKVNNTTFYFMVSKCNVEYVYFIWRWTTRGVGVAKTSSYGEFSKQ